MFVRRKPRMIAISQSNSGARVPAAGKYSRRTRPIALILLTKTVATGMMITLVGKYRREITALFRTYGVPRLRVNLPATRGPEPASKLIRG